MLKGFKRGLEQIADFLKMEHTAVTAGNEDAQLALMQVRAMWFKELTGASIEARQWNMKNIALSIAFGHDPFSASRAMLREVKETHFS